MAKLTAPLCGVAMAAAAATGAWAGEFAHSETKLLQGEFAAERWTAGVQIDLAEGWKTYWRMPGEAGIAPEFDWSQSRNVADVELRWPAPGRYHDASGETVGYANRVVFPLSIRPQDPSQPVELALQLSYAVCKDICIPARSELSLVLAQASTMSSVGAAVIRQFEARVPQPEVPGVSLERASLDDTGTALWLAVELSGAAVDPSTDIFVENFADAYFRAARPKEGEGSGEAMVFHLPIEGLADPDLLRGRTLLLTVVTATEGLVSDVTVE